MDLRRAQRLALRLMCEHGLDRRGWEFAWGRGKSRFGAAVVQRRRDPRTGRWIERRRILLSRPLTAMNSEDEVRDTVLHEIAHALAGLEHGHGAQWKEVCVRIGAKPERLMGEDVRLVQARYALVCGTCERVLGHRHRRMAGARLTRCYCRHCGPSSVGALRMHDLATQGPAQG